MKNRWITMALIVAVGLVGVSSSAGAAAKKVKVFILAGQSNMEGHGQVRSLPHLGNHPKYGHLLKKLKASDGSWAVRDDVTISYKAPQRKKRSGPLTVGWGSEKHELGPELMFGAIMGDKYDEHVLLIKTAWGGKDVICDFRSPGAGKPAGDEAAFFAHRRKEGDRREIGRYYRMMVAEVKETLAGIKDVVPGYKGQGYEIAGMAWFQGWNDLGAYHFHLKGKHLGKSILNRYKHNLAAMIRDLRKDLDAPNMPVVIGELGIGGHEMTKRAAREGRDFEAESIVELRKLQKAVADDPKLKGVTFVPTLDYWDVRLQELRVISNAYWDKKQKAGIKDTEENHLPTKELNDEFLRLGHHWTCHYNGSAATYSLIGNALAEALNKPKDAPKTPRTLTVTECFGVSHPDQIIDFDLPAGPPGSNVHVIETGANRAVPFQLLERGRKLAVRTNLPAGATKTWKLVSGPGPGAEPRRDRVRVTETKQYYEITNGVTGIRVPTERFRLPAALSAWPGLFNIRVRKPFYLPAPVQGVLLRDGTWTATGPNALQTLADEGSGKMKVVLLEKGPLKTVVRVHYAVTTPSYDYGQIHLKDAGPGRHTTTITLTAGSPSILFEEETDLEVIYGFDIYRGVEPTNGRYRGHHATRKDNGYQPDGRVYGMSHARAPMDAQVDFTYKKPKRAAYTSNGCWRHMAVWDPWIFDSGRYWQVFNRDKGPDANIVGIFAGRPSRAIGAGACGVGINTFPAAKGPKPRLLITVESYRRSASAAVFPKSRFQWGLFIGSKGRDMKPPTEIQPIAQQMNLHGGVNLNKLHRLTLDFPDPPQGYGAMYMKKTATARLIKKLCTDEAYFRWAYNAEPSGRDLIDFWRKKSARQADAPVRRVLALARDMLQQFVHGDGVYSFRYHYWHGGLEMSRKLLWIDQLLGSDQVSGRDKRRLKAAAVLFASVLHDNDCVPLDNHKGFNLGNPNMPVQQQNYRKMYALFLARHPMMADRIKGVAGAARSMLERTVNEHGAHMGSLHYVGASNGPLLATLQQLQMAGVYDAFATEERLARFAEFYMQALTPPEVRFGGRRKMVAIGDGATEGTEEYGMLGTGFARCNPKLSARLMGAWREEGKVHSGFHGSTLLKIDDDLSAVTPNLGDARFPGYYSVLRSGWGTPRENALWCVNGNFYADHCHNDLGSLVIYTLGVPLSVDFGSFYTPHASGGAMHSTVIQESAFGQAWDRDVTDLRKGGGFSAHYGNVGVGEATALDVFPEGRRMLSTIRGGLKGERTEWRRAVTLINADPAAPLILVQDTFGGKDAAAPKIMTLNLMARGEVETPVGKQTPKPRTHARAEHKTSDPKHQLPSAGPVFTLSAGVSRLGFTGQLWKGHPTGGIDWDVYQISPGRQQAHVGHWAHVSSPAAHEFKRAQGRPFEESQYILRVRGKGPFTTLIVPWAKGKKPERLSVTLRGETIVVTTAAGSTRFDPNGFSVTIGRKTTRRIFSDRSPKK